MRSQPYVIARIAIHDIRELIWNIKGKTVGLFAGLLVLHGILVRIRRIST